MAYNMQHDRDFENDTIQKYSYYYTLHATTMSSPLYMSEKLESEHPKWMEVEFSNEYGTFTGMEMFCFGPNDLLSYLSNSTLFIWVHKHVIHFFQCSFILIGTYFCFCLLYFPNGSVEKLGLNLKQVNLTLNKLKNVIIFSTYTSNKESNH